MLQRDEALNGRKRDRMKTRRQYKTTPSEWVKHSIWAVRAVEWRKYCQERDQDNDQGRGELKQPIFDPVPGRKWQN